MEITPYRFNTREMMTNLGDLAQMPKTDNPRIAAHNVELAKVRNGFFHQLGRLRDLPHIGLEGDGVGPEGLDRGHDLVGRLARVGVIDDDLGTGAAELGSDSSADATS